VLDVKVSEARQDFTFHEPVIASQDKLGVRSRDTLAAGRYCFASGTRVATEFGLIPIEQIPKFTVAHAQLKDVLARRCELPVRMKVASRGAARPALFWINSGLHDTVRVSTRHDYSVRCTPNEPFLILNCRLQFEWKAAAALNPGDMLCLSRNPQVHGEDGTTFVEGFPSGQQTAQFAGLLSGAVQERNGAYVLTFNKYREAHVSAMLALEVFGLDLAVHIEPVGQCYELTLKGASVSRFAKGLRPDGVLPQARSLPDALFRASPVETARFCLGLCQSTSGAAQRGAVQFLEFALGTREVAKELKLVLLQMLGVTSGRIHQMDGGGYLMRVAGKENLRRFFTLLMSSPTGELVAAGRRPLPFHSAAMAGLSEAGREAAIGDYFFDPVRSVEADEPTWVYDLTVPQTHAFVANGFVVHNTEPRPTAFS